MLTILCALGAIWFGVCAASVNVKTEGGARGIWVAPAMMAVFVSASIACLYLTFYSVGRAPWLFSN